MKGAEGLRVKVNGSGEVSALLERPSDARWMLVLAHGAGAGMKHPYLERLSKELGSSGVATFRYQFPYMENKRRVPDSPAVLAATVAAAAGRAMELAPDLPLFAGGKSMGGRMTSTAASEGLLPRVRGLVFFGFPLHPPGQPGTKRAEHLDRVRVPMMFLQGTRDVFAELDLLRPICERLGSLATLHVIDDADHSFHVPKRSGRTDLDVMQELVATFVAWIPGVLSGG
jgi:predicted alpha/beta-hydrolase family hydrolase